MDYGYCFFYTPDSSFHPLDPFLVPNNVFFIQILFYLVPSYVKNIHDTHLPVFIVFYVSGYPPALRMVSLVFMAG